jgi:hypothetical protein
MLPFLLPAGLPAAPTFTGLITADGGQVKYPATQLPSSDPNTLDDYEEGTFSPTLRFGGASTGMTLAVQKGRYIKIGSKVSVFIYLALSAKGSATGVASVGALPFVSKTDSGMFWGGNTLGYGNLAAGISVLVPSASTLMLLYKAVVSATDADFAANSEFAFTLEYEAAN